MVYLFCLLFSWNSKLQLFDNLGQTIYTISSSKNNYQFNQIGVYFYKVYNYSTKKVQLGKIIIGN
jgi:hypothetical protein